MGVRNSQKVRTHPRKIRKTRIKINVDGSEEEIVDHSKTLALAGAIVFVLLAGYLVYRFYG